MSFIFSLMSYPVRSDEFRRLIFVTEISLIDLYEVNWVLQYEELKNEPNVKPDQGYIQILTKVRR